MNSLQVDRDDLRANAIPRLNGSYRGREACEKGMKGERVKGQIRVDQFNRLR